MRQRGRKSFANQSVIALRPDAFVLRPPPGTPEHVAKIFREVVASVPPGHFVAADASIVLAYCEAAHLAHALSRQAARKPVITKYWATAARTQAALSVKLRLNPHSRTRADGTGRRFRSALPPSAYDDHESQTHDDD